MAANKSSNNDQLPDSPIQQEIEEKVREMLGPDYTEAEATLDRPPEPEPEQMVEPEKNVEIKTVEDNDIPESFSEDGESEELEDPSLVRAVEEIEHRESDQLLAAEDAELEAAFKPQKTGLSTKIKRFFKAWWLNPIARWTTIAVIVFGLIASAVYPKSRYFVLNNLGVRASASVVITDNSSKQPIKNAMVTIHGMSGTTDQDGAVRIDHIKLGLAKVTIDKRAYATQENQVTIGWGSNPLGDFQLTPSGVQYQIKVTDFLSGQPINDAEASSGGSDASSDENGVILLSIAPGDDNTRATISAKGYRAEQVMLNEDPKQEQAVTMVPDRKSVFVSKRSGKLDVYKIDIDGKNEAVTLKASGIERSDITLLSHPTDEILAVVSTRENVRNSDGYLLSTLTIVDLKDDNPTKAAQSESIKLLGWSGSKLAFVQTAAGASAANPGRQRLIVYDYQADKSQEIAAANYFNDFALVGDNIYYAKSGTYQSTPGGFYKYNIGSNKTKPIIEKETWQLSRPTYSKLNLGVENDWFEYVLGADSASKLAGPPANPMFRQYHNTSDNKLSAWVDQRDGKGVLLLHDIETNDEDKVLINIAGLSEPIRWLTDQVLIYRINSPTETADYAVNIQNGQPVKIQDVTATLGIRSGY